ncbi:rab11 family-interacting protein 1 isoform X2 [Zootermopsis nevadensis]|uniref:rab11 family-interacting protein 1 isoform X2 n=1 Tax=Zootermopsis nevadensis TaxID=136037 RepID=UPI000B8EE832|nr:rab11 family-interacting protein 1 isoform X2 [Zootermopsis nevadensis]
MWSPTHVQVTVQRARGLLTKGKHGTNDAFVTIALGKEKYQTSVKEKALQDVDWHEECELQIPKQGNVAEIVLTVLHRNFIGVDEFLGVVNIPLADFDVYERPRNRWYDLKSKPGKEKNKPRGELEVRVAFLVKAGSLTDLSNKPHRSSMGHLSHMAHSVGGSLLSIGSLEKRKGLKKLAKNLVKKSKKSDKEVSLDGNSDFRTSRQMSAQVAGDADPGVISEGESEDDFTFDDLSHKSSGSSINTNQTSTVTPVVGSLENLAGGEVLRRTSTAPVQSPVPVKSTVNRTVDEWERKLYGKQGKDVSMDTLKRRSWDKAILSSQPEEEEPETVPTPKEASPPPAITLSPVMQAMPQTSAPQTPVPTPRKFEPDEPEKKEDEKEKVKEGSRLARKFKQFRKESKMPEIPQTEERIIIGGENEGTAVQSPPSRLAPEVLLKFEGKSREDLIETVCSLQASLEHQSRKLKDLEDYLDNLLLRVMETTPRILQNPYVSCKAQANLRLLCCSH